MTKEDLENPKKKLDELDKKFNKFAQSTGVKAVVRTVLNGERIEKFKQDKV